MIDNRKSQAVTQGVQRAPNRAMLRAVGFQDGDFNKPIVGLANGYSTITPCNMGIDDWHYVARKRYEKRAQCLKCSAPSPSATASRWAPKE